MNRDLKNCLLLFESMRKGSLGSPRVRNAALGIALVSTVLVTAAGSDGAHAVADLIRDPGSILASRSPGRRLPGAMHQTKTPYAEAVPPMPGERVRPVATPAAPPEPDMGIPGSPPAAFAAVPDAPAETGDVLESSPVDTDANGRPVYFGVVPFPDTSDFGIFIPLSYVVPGIPGTPGTPVIPGGPTGPGSPAPAVPEPATWAMMIGGFFLAGGVMRRARFRDPVVPGAR